MTLLIDTADVQQATNNTYRQAIQRTVRHDYCFLKQQLFHNKLDSHSNDQDGRIVSLLVVVEQPDGLGVQRCSALLLLGAGSELFIALHLFQVTQQWRRLQGILSCHTTYHYPTVHTSLPNSTHVITQQSTRHCPTLHTSLPNSTHVITRQYTRHCPTVHTSLPNSTHAISQQYTRHYPTPHMLLPNSTHVITQHHTATLSMQLATAAKNGYNLLIAVLCRGF